MYFQLDTENCKVSVDYICGYCVCICTCNYMCVLTKLRHIFSVNHVCLILGRPELHRHLPTISLT